MELQLPLDEAGPADRRSLNARAEETEIDLAWSLYVEMATRCALTVPTEKSPARVKAIKRILATYGGLEKWRLALSLIEKSRDLRGENRKKFKAHIDYVLSPKYFVQIVEGVFDQDWGKPLATKKSGVVERAPEDRYRQATLEEREIQLRLFNGASSVITQRQADWYRHQDVRRADGVRARWTQIPPKGWTKPRAEE